MRAWIVTAVMLALVAPAAAGKRKGAVSARIEYGTPTTVKGLSIAVTLTNHKERAEGG
jgi:hypothetical protein